MMRLLGTKLNDKRLVQKILVTVREKIEATLVNFKDLMSITLSELSEALQVGEQWRLIWQLQEGYVAFALVAKTTTGKETAPCPTAKRSTNLVIIA